MKVCRHDSGSLLAHRALGKAPDGGAQYEPGRTSLLSLISSSEKRG